MPYACLGVACAGLLYLVLSALFKVFGPKRVMRFFPPVVTGPIVIAIGLILAKLRHRQRVHQLAGGHRGHRGHRGVQHLGHAA